MQQIKFDFIPHFLKTMILCYFYAWENAKKNTERAEKRGGYIEQRQHFKMPLFGELSRSSRDSFQSDSDLKESQDDRLDSPKSGISRFRNFLAS